MTKISSHVAVEKYRPKTYRRWVLSLGIIMADNREQVPQEYFSWVQVRFQIKLCVCVCGGGGGGSIHTHS